MDITTLIPHRPPMLLVDKVLEVDEDAKTMVASKLVREEEYYTQGHYPGMPIVPGVITCEMMFQTGAALSAHLAKVGKLKAILSDKMAPVVTRISNTKFKQMIRPGDEVILKLKLNRQMSTAVFLEGKAFVNDKLCAQVEFCCMLAPMPTKESE